MTSRPPPQKNKIKASGLPMTTTSPASAVFHGWFVVAAAFAVMFIGFGAAYSFSAFVDPLQGAFGASRGEVSLIFSLAGFLYFALGLITGPIADRWGARPITLAGMVFVGLGMILAAQATSMNQVYIAYGLGVGLGVGCSYVPAIACVQRWFTRKRAFASGLAVAGIGVGTLVVPPAASLAIEALGWRTAWEVMGVAAIVLGAGMALLLEADPRHRGLAPDGGAAATVQGTGPAPGMSVAEALRSRAFFQLYLSGTISAFGVFVPFVHLVPYATDRGTAPATAALLLGVIGIGSTAGRFMLGGIADRLGRRTTLVCMYVGMGASLIIWAGFSSLWALGLFAFLYGVFYGGWVAVLPSVVMDTFGSRNVSGIIGILYTCVAVGTLVGPTAAGYIYDASGSYLLPILVAMAGNFTAAGVMAMGMRRGQ